MQEVIKLEEVSSTNAVLKAMPEAKHGTVLLAKRQTAGRGRLGRSFASPEGGLYLSWLLCRKETPEQLLHLTPMVAVAVRRAIADACGLWTDIKWINDLQVQGKKVCGILTELDSLGRIIVGIGINCHTTEFPAELQDIAASLHEFVPVDEDALLQALLLQLEALDKGLIDQKSQWMAEYAAACITVGREVELVRGDSRRSAFAEAVDENGALLVRLPDGTRETVYMGEASVRLSCSPKGQNPHRYQSL